jgi:hypothetical protein
MRLATSGVFSTGMSICNGWMKFPVICVSGMDGTGDSAVFGDVSVTRVIIFLRASCQSYVSNYSLN